MHGENEDYLWEGSGEPDPEIRELEDILGNLRHKSTAPKLPVNEPASSVYKYAPMLAIAATILIVIGAGVWVALHVSAKGRQTDQVSVASGTGDSDRKNQAPDVKPTPPEQPARDEHSTLAGYRAPRKKHVKVLNPELQGLTAEEIREGREAKAQLMLAMQITSSKLSQAKHRVQEDGRPSRS